MTAADALTGGFADPVFDAQAVFRSVLDAFASPGKVIAIGGVARPPAPLHPTTGAILAALADADTPIHLDEAAEGEDVRRWLAFHTGAPLTDNPAKAAFAVAGEGVTLALAGYAQGTAEYPDRSTTLIVQVRDFAGPTQLRLAGPGIRDTATLAPEGLARGFADELRANRARFPLGVDLILAAPTAIAALPRSVRVAEAG